MSELTVRQLGEGEWQEFRAVRLEALRDSPEAFSATLEEESALPDAEWQARMRRSPRFLAERAGQVLGVASLGTRESDTGEILGEVFGLWVTPIARGTGVATALVKAAANRAQAADFPRIVYWVSTDNGRAVAFASGLGFRPTDSRRPMRGARHQDEEEIAMVLALGEDRGTRPDLS